MSNLFLIDFEIWTYAHSSSIFFSKYVRFFWGYISQMFGESSSGTSSIIKEAAVDKRIEF